MFRYTSVTPEQVEFVRKDSERSQALASSVIAQCEKSANELSEISINKRFFLQHLAVYLKKRKTQNSGLDNDSEIQTRSYFIQKIVNQITTGKKPDLDDEKIKEFKGIFSHKMYDICKQYRDSREEMELPKMKSRSI